MVRDMKDPMIMLGTPRPTSLYTKHNTDTIMVMIKTEEIIRYLFWRSTLQYNIIRLYRIIWVNWYSALQSELEGNPDYSAHLSTYDCLWMLTKIKMYTSGINHTYNGCYYEVMSMRDILCLWQGWDEPIEAYYRRFEAAISTYKIEKFTATTHMKLNKTYTVGKDDNVTKRFQEMCLLVSANFEWY